MHTHHAEAREGARDPRGPSRVCASGSCEASSREGGGALPYRGRVWGGATRGRAAHRGGGRASDGEHRTNAQRRTGTDGNRDEHGVAGVSDVIIGTASSVAAGDTVQAEQSLRAEQRRTDGGAEPARRRKHNTPVMFSEGQARGLRPLQCRASSLLRVEQATCPGGRIA